jgi:hypothetical protein
VLQRALTPYAHPHGVHVPGSHWLVTAHR